MTRHTVWDIYFRKIERENCTWVGCAQLGSVQQVHNLKPYWSHSISVAFFDGVFKIQSGSRNSVERNTKHDMVAVFFLTQFSETGDYIFDSVMVHCQNNDRYNSHFFLFWFENSNQGQLLPNYLSRKPQILAQLFGASTWFFTAILSLIYYEEHHFTKNNKAGNVASRVSQNLIFSSFHFYNTSALPNSCVKIGHKRKQIISGFLIHMFSF